jgi:hypothetical protein
MQPTTYTCKKCGTTVPFVNGVLTRPCGCDAPIIANLHAVARGISAVAQPK